MFNVQPFPPSFLSIALTFFGEKCCYRVVPGKMTCCITNFATKLNIIIIYILYPLVVLWVKKILTGNQLLKSICTYILTKVDLRQSKVLGQKQFFFPSEFVLVVREVRLHKCNARFVS